jgi:hypothetical protein
MAELPRIDAENLRLWQRELAGLRNVPAPNMPNVPKHPIVFLMWTCDDGLERTKTGYKVPEAMLPHLEALFPGDLDEQKWAYIDLLRRTGANLIYHQADVLAAAPNAPSAMEWLEAEAIARLPSTPEDDAERWQRLRDMRREWLFGHPPADVWTGARQPIESSGVQGNYHQKRGAERARLLAMACDAVHAHWQASLDEQLTFQQVVPRLTESPLPPDAPLAEQRRRRRRIGRRRKTAGD